VFSSRHACPVCGYSVRRLPNPSSSHSTTPPAPARSAMDSDARSFSIASAWSGIRTCRSRAARSAAGIAGTPTTFSSSSRSRRQYDFDIEMPWVELPQKIQDVLLNGSGDQIIEFRYVEGSGRAHKRRHRFEGILPNLERRYRKPPRPRCAKSLPNILGMRTCAECGGARLNRAARFVFVRRPHPARCCAADDWRCTAIFPLLEPARLARRGRGQDSSRTCRSACASWLTSVLSI